MNDITKLLGLPVQYIASPQKDRLPRYLTEAYELQAAQVGSVPVLFLFPKAGLASTQTLEKHMKRLEQLCLASAVLVLPSVSRYRRNALVEAHLPFVVPGHQVYLPFLGASLLERFSPEIPVPLAPASQQMFLWYLYGKKKELYVSEAVHALPYSAMTVSRAARQMVETGIFSEKKIGVQKILYSDFSGRELFEKMLPFLTDPVKATRFVWKSQWTLPCYPAGITALAAHTMLNPENPPCYAGIGPISGTKQLIDSGEQFQMQFWKYDPAWFRRKPDPLSLFLSLRNHPDERVEEALEGYIQTFWEEYDGSRN